jgi:hypothetical protein
VRDVDAIAQSIAHETGPARVGGIGARAVGVADRVLAVEGFDATCLSGIHAAVDGTGALEALEIAELAWTLTGSIAAEAIDAEARAAFLRVTACPADDLADGA